MSLLNYPFPLFKAYEPAVAEHIQKDFEAIKTWSQQIDDVNVLNSGLTLSAKGKAGTIDSTLMGTGAIRNSAVDYTSSNLGVKAIRFASGTYPGTGGCVAVRCRKSYTLVSNTNEQEITVSFTSDSIDGATTFSAAPIVVYSIEEGASPAALDVAPTYNKLKKDGVTTTSAKILLKFGSAPTGGVIYINLIAIGGVA